MKKIVTIFFLILISVQFLPIRQVGMLISSNTIIEEEVISHMSKAVATLEDIKPVTNYELTPRFFLIRSFDFAPFKHAFYEQPVKEKCDPPPNA